jgi:hypothetical protein
MLKDAGAKVIGPFSRAEQAREAVRRGANSISAAVLDINIAGVAIYPPAEDCMMPTFPSYSPQATTLALFPLPSQACAGCGEAGRPRQVAASACKRHVS